MSNKIFMNPLRVMKTLIHRKHRDNNSLFDISMYSQLLFQKMYSNLAISSINLFWMALCIYSCWPYQDVLIEPGNCYSLKSYVRFSLSSLPLKANPWGARKRMHSITFIKYFLSARRLLFRSLTVISNTSPH